MKDTSKTIKDKLATLKQEYLKTAREEFKIGTDQLFKDNPTLISFSFTAYTPYFNDGDECTYRTNTDYPDINGIEEYGDGYDKKLKKIVVDFLGQFDDDIYQDIIGNHVKVTITSEGIETEGYEHD